MFEMASMCVARLVNAFIRLMSMFRKRGGLLK